MNVLVSGEEPLLVRRILLSTPLKEATKVASETAAIICKKPLANGIPKSCRMCCFTDSVSLTLKIKAPAESGQLSVYVKWINCSSEALMSCFWEIWKHHSFLYINQEMQPFAFIRFTILIACRLKLWRLSHNRWLQTCHLHLSGVFWI